MSSGGTTPAYRASELVALATALFRRAGLDPDEAGTVAEILVEGDLLGHTTHGLALAAPYLAALDAGSMTRHGDPAVVSDRGGALCWDSRRLPGPWLVVRAIEQALARARARKRRGCDPREPSHRLPRVVSRACDLEGLHDPVDLLRPSEASVAPYGGLQALFTPDPIAVGIPTDGDPILIDMSASITTNGITGRLHKEGRCFPGDWAMTASGAPTDDPGVLFAEPRGTLLPTGGREYGHKGYHLALLIEALSQGLAGHGRADRPTGWGASVYLQIMDPAAFGGGDSFVRQTGFIAATCRRSPPAPGMEAVRLPGEQGLARRRRARAEGLHLYPGIMEALAPWAERFDVVPPAPAD
jgi:LDH2 family malate/lactate/ureidoglycolate dehydrogenase